MIIIVSIMAVLVVCIIWLYNKIVNLKNKVKQSKSGIDVYLQERFNLIPNLIETTKGYMNYEKETLEKITQMRAKYNESKDKETTNGLNVEYWKIMVVAENYPELKANEQFAILQKSLIKIESQLQAARRIYNNDVTKYNTKISTFPNNTIAKLFKFKDEELFELEGEKNVKINF